MSNPDEQTGTEPEAETESQNHGKGTEVRHAAEPQRAEPEPGPEPEPAPEPEPEPAPEPEPSPEPKPKPKPKAASAKRNGRGVPLRTLLAPLVASLVFALVDTLAAAKTGSLDVGMKGWLIRFGYLLPWFLGVAWAVSAARDLIAYAANRGAEVRGFALDEGVGRDSVLAVGAPAALFLFGSFVAILTSFKKFNNHTLAAMLLGLGLCGLLAACWAVWSLVLWLMRADTDQLPAWLAQHLLRVASPLSFFVTVGYLARRNREGLDIVGGWFFAGPIAFALTLTIVWIAARRIRTDSRVPSYALGAAFLAAVGVAFGVGSLDTGLPDSVAESNSWSAKFIAVGRTATDVDRDGFSSLFGGGDCAPFDKSRNPGATEIIKDGIDNDCFGGDAQKAYQETRPKWVERPKQLSKIQNVVVIVIEALRPDAVSFIRGEGPKTTPNIDALAEQSIVFPRMSSSAAATLWAMASLWTTYPPTKIYWRRHKSNNKRYLDKSMRMFPQRLQSAGFKTHAFTMSFDRLQPKGGIGLHRAFDTYDSKEPADSWRGRPSKALVTRAQKIIARKRPFLAFLHFVEPHGAYVRDPESPDFGKKPRDLYHSEVWSADKQVGRVVKFLKQKKLFDKTVILVTGDHGEAFGEHGRRSHGSRIYEEQTRTMGVMWVPGAKHRVIDMPVSHQDIGSTLMNLVNVRKEFDQLYGLNLLPYILGAPQRRDSPVILHLHAPKRNQVALIRGDFKLIYNRFNGKAALHNLKTDPGELKDVKKKHPKQYGRMLAETRAYNATQIEIE